MRLSVDKDNTRIFCGRKVTEIARQPNGEVLVTSTALDGSGNLLI